MGLPYMFSLQGYCENCPEFVPRVKTEEIKHLDGKTIRNHTVSCMHEALCAGIVEHILGQVTRHE